MTQDDDNFSPATTDLTGFQLDQLYALADLQDGERNVHGLRIKEYLENYYHKEIHHGRLYPNLDTLVDLNLVRKGKIDRRTNYYELTDRGARELHADQGWRKSAAKSYENGGTAERADD